MKIVRSLVSTLLLAAGVAVAAPAMAQQTVKLSLLPFSESLAAVVADKQGYFKEQGLDVQTTQVASGALAMPLLLAGSIDIAFGNTISTLQAIEQGLDATILAPGAVARTTPPDSTTALLVLKDSPVKDVKELAGKRVAVNVINSSAWMYMTSLLEQNGVDPKSVQFVEIPFPQMNTPLLNKQIDAVAQVDPFATVLIKGGQARALAYPYVATSPNTDISQYIAMTAWVKKNPDTAKRFVAAIDKAVAYINNPANDATVRDINVQFTNLNPDLKNDVMYAKLGTSVNVAEITKTMEQMLKKGLIKKPVDIPSHIYKP